MDPPTHVTVKVGETASVKITCRLAPGYHTNSNTPADEYLIPLRLTWEPAPLEVTAVEYPKGHLEKYQFSEKPLSVYSGDFEIVTKLNAPAKAPRGPRTIAGKLRYQACTNTVCYPPKTVPVQLAVDVK